MEGLASRRTELESEIDKFVSDEDADPENGEISEKPLPSWPVVIGAKDKSDYRWSFLEASAKSVIPDTCGLIERTDKVSKECRHEDCNKQSYTSKSYDPAHLAPTV